MRLLILNWRDIRSRRGGGAERVTHEVARRLVERGNTVVWLSSKEDGLPAEETNDGIRILRRGSELTTRFFARGVARDFKPDVILEEINTLPYFAPQWSRTPVVLYMNQLARDVWWYEAPLPLAAVGWLSEPFYLQAYRGCRVVTISNSSRDDLRRFGLGSDITVVPLAIDVPVVAALTPKRRDGQLLAIGRLTPSKRFDHAIDVLALLTSTHPDATITVVGAGRDHDRLLRHASDEAVAERVFLPGQLSEEQKIAALDAADVLVGTSVREGWGLTVTEAAARATPAAVYDTPGFRDSVIDRRTGVVSAPSPHALADRVRWLLADAARYDDIRERARARVSASGSWDETARVFELVLAAAARA